MRPLEIAAGILLAVGASGCFRANVNAREPSAPESASATGVREARARFNAAIERRDTLAIRRLLLPSYHIVNGRSVQRHGQEAGLAMWTDAYRGDSSVSYVRTPRTVRVNEAWGLAAEAGDWTGDLAGRAGRVRSSGVYAAKWQRTSDGEWRLQAETFTTLDCQGSAGRCPPPDPITP
jgi:ketosteroid isomerase-like protein